MTELFEIHTFHCFLRQRPDPTAGLTVHAGIREVGMAAMAPLFVRPVRNQNAWRPVLGRLQLISQLLPLLGIAR